MDVYKNIVIIILFTIITPVVCAQKINTISLTARSSTLFDMSAITVAGGHTATMVDNTQWLNYGIRDNTSLLYTIQVSSVTPVPPGLEIRVELGPFYGTGGGGQPTGPKLISTTPTVLVNNMPQGVTGVGQLCGHNVILSFGITNFALLHPSNFTINLVYTLSAQ